MKSSHKQYGKRLLILVFSIIMWMLFTQIFGTIWTVSVASVFVFICKLGILGVFLAVLLDEGVRVLINFWKYLRIVKKWRE
jgi:Na+-driven multidrug efflux pump